jgi:hypothetical protein
VTQSELLKSIAFLSDERHPDTAVCYGRGYHLPEQPDATESFCADCRVRIDEDGNAVRLWA